MTITHSAIGLVTAAILATGVLVGLNGWPLTAYTLSLAGLALCASIVAFVDAKRSFTSDVDAMQPSFVVVFVTLLLLGGPEAMVVAAAAAVAHGLSEAPHPRRAARTLGRNSDRRRRDVRGG